MKKVFIWGLALIIMLSLTLFGISCKEEATEEAAGEATEEAAGEVVAEEMYEFTFVSLLPVIDVFETIVKGMNLAAEQVGVEATYLGPDSMEVDDQIDILNTVIAGNPDGIALMATAIDPFMEPVNAALAKGIPIVGFNTFLPEVPLPYLTYVGSDIYRDGRRCSESILENTTPKGVLIAHHWIGHAGLDQRAAGVKEAMEDAGIPVEIVDITQDDTTAVGNIKAYLAKNPDTDTFVGLWTGSAKLMVGMVKDGDLPAGSTIGTFDAAIDTLNSIKEGEILLTVDQQPFLQGYYPIHVLFLYNEHGLIPDETIHTGRAVITADNVDGVIAQQEMGFR